MSSTEELSTPSTVVLTPTSSTQSLTNCLDQDAVTRNTPPLFAFEGRVEQAAEALTPRYANSSEPTDAGRHDDSSLAPSSHSGVFSTDSFANVSFHNFLSCPPGRFAHSSSRGTSQTPLRALERPGSINQHRTQRPSYSFRNLHNVTPEPPEREDQYSQISNVRDAFSHETSARITSFPAEREDAYLQVVSDHLPAFHTDNETISSSEIDGIVRETSSLAIGDPLPHVVYRMEGSSSPANGMIHQAQELQVESGIKYARYDPKDEAAPRTLYFSRNFQDAIKSGRDICGRIAQTLQSCELAQDNQSQMHGLLQIARRLENFRSPVTVTIGVVGDSGAGTSVILSGCNLLTSQRQK
jgi:hypothetical protein